ncbi:group II truncated hemoglobin [Streptomyces sp. NPDC060194]|uniref:group II truncated hemoglobin n=1 Tax=Streptomyces sp. NPDC060194 TaxID=3347069 RepID=UPI00364C7017
MADTGRTVQGVFGPRLPPGGVLEEQRHGTAALTPGARRRLHRLRVTGDSRRTGPAAGAALYRGAEAFARLTDAFYARVVKDEVLAPVFDGMSPDHAAHVALWLGEVFGGPAVYTAEHGGCPAMLAHHLDRALTEAQRSRWVALLTAAADEVGLPDDPEFRSAFVAYLEWGTRIALANSQPGAAPPRSAPVPRWGWGEAPPYVS